MNAMFKRYAPHAAVILLSSGIAVGVLTYTNKSPSYTSKSPYGSSGSYYDIDTQSIQFLDNVESQTLPRENLTDLVLFNVDGSRVQLKDYINRKNVVLVITRGFSSSICLYCSTQTSRLIANYSEFTKRDTEVVVVFPVREDADRGRLDEFISATKENMDRSPDVLPFPVLLDVELKVVDTLGIRHELSRPATFILDKEGEVRFSYVGKSLSDRPSVKALLKQLDSLAQGPG
jgi:peroxiredoxin